MYTNVFGIMRDLDKERADYERKWAVIRKAGENVRPALLARICQKYELEPDEFYTAEQKAAQFL